MPCRLTGRVSFPAELEATSRAASLLRSGWQYSLEATMHGKESVWEGAETTCDGTRGYTVKNMCI